MTDLRFEFRILSGDEIIAEDFTTFSPENINEFGGCETVDVHIASALRAGRREQLQAQSVVKDGCAC